MNSAAEAVVDIAIKEAVFIQYIQKNAPGVGRSFAFVAEVTKGFKDKQTSALADRSSGKDSENFMEMYSQFKKIAPGVAGAGFAKASIVAEYLAKEVPGIAQQVINMGGNVMDNIGNYAPAVLAAAESIGSSMAAFVVSQGPAVADALETAGGSALAFYQKNAPAELQDAAKQAGVGAVQLAGIIGKEMPGILGAVEGVSGQAASAVAQGASVVMQNFPGGARMVAEQLGNVASALPGVAATAMDAVSSVVTADVIVNVTTAALGVLGTAAAAFPFLLPLQIAMKDIGNAVQHATYNREAANILGGRCADCSLLVVEMAPKLDKAIGNKQEQEATMKPLASAIAECTEFLGKFTKKGFISVMISWKKDDRSLSVLDKKVTNAIQNLSVRINGHQLDQQLEDSEKLDKMFRMLDNFSPAVLAQPQQIDPKVFAEIARQAGCQTADQISSELEGVGYKLDEIKDAVAEVMTKIDAMDKKLDNIANQISQSMEEQRHQNEDLKTIILQSQAEMRKHEQLTLDKMRDLVSGKSITRKFSTTQQTKQLARRAEEVAAAGADMIVIHSHGVGFKTMNPVNGTDGLHGRSGLGNIHGANGSYGSGRNIDGQDGEDGADGHDGEDGTDGCDGTNAENFEVFIEYVSEDIKKGTRRYKIEHSGVNGKDEHMVDIKLTKQVFFIFGKGGVGGKGGNGGNGGSGGNGGNGGGGGNGSGQQLPDGGNGGNGGRGGDGGVGGLSGGGGKGADGAEIVIHTNDPSVLAVMYIDVSEGEGGKAGVHGTSGTGGTFGTGGGQGEAGSWSETVGGGPNGAVSYVSKYGRPGRAGKPGAKGKHGKPPTAKPSKNGTDGQSGTVSICLYDNTGLSETGGTPYRIVLNKNELAKLNPAPLIYGTLSKQFNDPFVYGQNLEYGPVLPVNIGSLYSPDSTMNGTIYFNFASPRSTSTSVPFPKIPGEEGTKYGSLPSSAARKLNLKIPQLKQSGFFLDENFWPWPTVLYTAVAQAKFVIDFAVDGISMRKSVQDGDNMGVKEYPITVDIPFEIVTPNTNVPIVCPSSMAINAGPQPAPSTATISFTVRNKLKCAKLKSADCKFTLRVAAMRFWPIMKCALTESRNFTPQMNEQNFLKVATTGFVNDLQPGQTQEVVFTITLPWNDGNNLVEPGAQILARGELYHEDYLACYTAPSMIRVAPPLPPVDGVSPFDVLVISNYSLIVEDYRAISQFYASLGLRVYYLDLDHFIDRQNGRIPIRLWQQQFGKSILVWLPATPAMANTIPNEDLFNHVRNGGGLIYGACCRFQWLDQATSRSAAARRVITIEGSSASLNSLRMDALMQDRKIMGKGLMSLLGATYSVLSTAQKLRYLKDKHTMLSGTQAGELVLDFYNSTVDTGCCGGGKVKVVPLQKTVCTLLDVLMVSIRTDISVDVKVFAASMNFNDCAATMAIVAFSNEAIKHQQAADQSLCMVARDVAAAANSAHLMDDKLFTSKPKKVWEKHSTEIRDALNACIEKADSQNLDYKSATQRTMDMDIIGGYSQRKKGIFSGYDPISFAANSVNFATKF